MSVRLLFKLMTEATEMLLQAGFKSTRVNAYFHSVTKVVSQCSSLQMPLENVQLSHYKQHIKLIPVNLNL